MNCIVKSIPYILSAIVGIFSYFAGTPARESLIIGLSLEHAKVAVVRMFDQAIADDQ